MPTPPTQSTPQNSTLRDGGNVTHHVAGATVAPCATATTSDPAAVLADLEAGEELIPIARLRDQAFMPKGRSGRRLDRGVPFRWSRSGVKAADGTRVKLEVIRTPGGYATTRAAALRFFSRLSGTATPTTAVATTPKQRERQIEAARRELAEARI